MLTDAITAGEEFGLGTGQRDTRIRDIYQMIMELAQGNFGYRCEVGEADDELSAITFGINMLAEELQGSTVKKDFLERLFFSIRDYVFILNMNLEIKDVNPMVVDAYQRDNKDDFLQDSLSQYFLNGRTIFNKALVKQLQAQHYIHELEGVIRFHTGKTVPVSISISKLPPSETDESSILVIARDIGYLKKTESELREINHDLNTLIYRSSHDLRGPIASLKGLVKVAGKDFEGNVQVGHYLKMIDTTVDRLNAILNDLFELSRINQAAVETQEVDLDAICKAIIQPYTLRSTKHKVELKYHISGAKKVKLPAALLSTVLQNLVENGFKYSDPNKERPFVDLQLEVSLDSLKVVVKDNGIGISPEAQKKVFDLFFRGTKDSNGTGLGLYIVKSSVNKMGGNVRLKSELGEGTTFRVLIPLEME